MRRATAVIGANFGDEGKGLLTDYVVSRQRTGDDVVVVRFNGGAQAGHTVVTPQGVRHVFHHFGSGTFLGASTFLSRFFLVNPILWKLEAEALRALGVHLQDFSRFVDMSAHLTTPYDMLLNQELERLRGASRHGSCGLGIHETLVRNREAEFATHVLMSRATIRETLERIRIRWIPRRFAELTSKPPSKTFLERVASNEIRDHYLEDFDSFLRWNVLTASLPPGHLVFEGAQGLLLDQDNVNFPYVTHSKTGLHNVLQLCREADIEALEAIYVTRAYLTRHGAGPFPTEDSSLYFPDMTNTSNEFQGALRFGSLDPLELRHRVAEDLRTRGSFPVEVSVAVTCLDQVSDHMQTYFKLVQHVPIAFMVYGPTRQNVLYTPSAPAKKAEWSALAVEGAE
jgi:adenylosuccinate synthase